jgi:hypothetical protein
MFEMPMASSLLTNLALNFLVETSAGSNSVDDAILVGFVIISDGE